MDDDFQGRPSEGFFLGVAVALVFGSCCWGLLIAIVWRVFA